MLTVMCVIESCKAQDDVRELPTTIRVGGHKMPSGDKIAISVTGLPGVACQGDFPRD